MGMKIGFFGSGNMAQALAFGFQRKNTAIEQYFFTPSQKKAQQLAALVQGHFIPEISLMPLDLDWYVLAFKPQSLEDFHFSFPKKARVLSLLAGVGLEKLQKKFSSEAGGLLQIARLMPNTPSKVAAGANLFYAPFAAREMENILESLGKLFLMNSEEELDFVTAFSGSGPALVFEYARIFEKHLVQGGMSVPKAREIVAQTFLGSAFLMENARTEGLSFETLREQVTSKKGVTYEALQEMKKHHLEDIMGGAFRAAHKRTLEIKQGL